MTTQEPAEILVIVGSSRNDGNTWALVNAVLENLPRARSIDLNAFSISPYDYGERLNDDFLEIARAMVAAKAIVFASPVYWYAMSAQMKTYFDRLSDLTDTHKALGKSLAGKTAFLIATGSAAIAPESFEPPFAETARYFNMHWAGMLYAQSGMVDADAAAAFAASFNATPTRARIFQ